MRFEVIRFIKPSWLLIPGLTCETGIQGRDHLQIARVHLVKLEPRITLLDHDLHLPDDVVEKLDVLARQLGEILLRCLADFVGKLRDNVAHRPPRLRQEPAIRSRLVRVQLSRGTAASRQQRFA